MVLTYFLNFFIIIIIIIKGTGKTPNPPFEHDDDDDDDDYYKCCWAAYKAAGCAHVNTTGGCHSRRSSVFYLTSSLKIFRYRLSLQSISRGGS
jgi:hypothetical protein